MQSTAETNALPVGDKYRPMYRMKPTDRWSLVTRDRKPIECETAGQAHKIAQDLIDAIENPVHLIEEEPQPLGNIEDWHRQREAKQRAERETVFGAVGPSTVFLRGGRQVQVEHKQRSRKVPA